MEVIIKRIKKRIVNVFLPTFWLSIVKRKISSFPQYWRFFRLRIFFKKTWFEWTISVSYLDPFSYRKTSQLFRFWHYKKYPLICLFKTFLSMGEMMECFFSRLIIQMSAKKRSQFRLDVFSKSHKPIVDSSFKAFYTCIDTQKIRKR